MRIKVPFTYVSTSKTRAGITREVNMDACAEAEVREVRAQDAPVVLRHGGFFPGDAPWGDEERERGRGLMPDLLDVRLIDGRLYEQVAWKTGYGGEARRYPATVADLDDAQRLFWDVKWVKTRGMSPAAKYWNERTSTVFIESQRDEAEKEVAEALDLVSIDGALYRASPEPMFLLAKGDRHEPGEHLRVVREPRYWDGHLFRLDEADLLVDLLRAKGRPEAVIANVAELAEVLDPGALKADIRHDAIHKAGRRLEDRSRWGLHDRSLDTMMAFADLKEVRWHGSQAASPEVIVGAMAALCDALEHEPRTNAVSDPHMAAAVARVEVAAWRKRAAMEDVEELDADLSAFALDATP